MRVSKNIYAKFIKRARLNHVCVYFRGSHFVFPTLKKTKRAALPDIKRMLHEMVDAI